MTKSKTSKKKTVAAVKGKLEVITTHINADFDAVASMIAAGKLYPKAIMVFPGSQEKNLRNFFIQSVIYLFNVAKVKEIKVEDIGRLILVDTRQPDRIGPLEKALQNKDLEIHIYDHHPEAPDDLTGHFEAVAIVGANATLMTEIISERGIGLTPEEATILALGIYEDTGSFTFRSTTPRDYRAAALLLEWGADLNVVAEMITRELTVDQVALLNDLLSAVQTHNINGIDVMVTQTTTEQYVDEMAVLVHKMMDMRNAQVLFALASMENRIYMVARSRLPQVNVGEIARQFGGGGHPSAAAATIKDMTIPQATVKLLRVLNLFLSPVRTAQDIMAFPVIHALPDSNLIEARELFVRYNINTLLVIDHDSNICGYVSRQNVAKALYHGLPSYSVSEFMTTEFGVVPPEATFQEIQKLIVEQNQQVVPVVKNGRAVGVITRTDLLNIFAAETNVPGSLVDESTDLKTGRTKKIQSLMRERLPKDILDFLENIGQVADGLGYGAYAVGGFVRDILLRQENYDIDVVIEGDALHYTDVFAQTHPEVKVRQHRKFNTATLIFPKGLKVDVTTARLEYYERPGALPIVEQGSIRMDLYRRDFTVNTLAVSLNGKDFGTVIDYFRGLKDIKDGYIRVLHNLSFVEDPTRVFRAIRFEQRFGFKIGKLTASLIQNAVKHDFFLKLSGKRLSGEIKLLLQEEDPEPAIARMAEFDLLKFIHPGLIFSRDTGKLFRRCKKVIDWFQLTYLSDNVEPWVIYFMGLLDGLTRLEMIQICKRLSLLKREREILVEEKQTAEKALGRIFRHREAKPSEIFFLLEPLSTESILFMMAKATRDEVVRSISVYFTKLRYFKPELTGEDLIKMGYQPGPLFKSILQKLLEMRLNGEIDSLENEIAYVKLHFTDKKRLSRTSQEKK